MRTVMVILAAVLALFSAAAAGAQQGGFMSDTFEVEGGRMTITFIRHATLMLDFRGTVIHVDPVGQYADYGKLPKADLILVTHEHGDHLDAEAIGKIRKQGTQIVGNAASARQVAGAAAMKNGESKTVAGILIEAIPAYNLSEGRTKFHPKGNGNGYVLTLGKLRLYIAGDTEDTVEMRALKGIDVAFLPMNLPYTMTPEQVAAAARAFRPKVLYPYHYGDTDPKKLSALLSGEAGIEVRIRPLP